MIIYCLQLVRLLYQVDICTVDNKKLQSPVTALNLGARDRDLEHYPLLDVGTWTRWMLNLSTWNRPSHSENKYCCHL